MTASQRIILIVTAGLVLSAGIYAPHEIIGRHQERVSVGYGWIHQPPEDISQVNTRLLLTEWFGLMLVGGLAWLAASPRRAEPRPQAIPKSQPEKPAHVPTSSEITSHPPPQSADAKKGQTAGIAPRSTFRAMGGFAFWVPFAILLAITGGIGRTLGASFPLIAMSIGLSLWTLFAWWVFRPLSSRARRYRHHCEAHDLDTLSSMLEGRDGAEDRARWRITEKERIRALDSALARKIEACGK